MRLLRSYSGSLTQYLALTSKLYVSAISIFFGSCGRESGLGLSLGPTTSRNTVSEIYSLFLFSQRELAMVRAYFLATSESVCCKPGNPPGLFVFRKRKGP